ncbi:Craniofacial development protein 1 [Mortierella sp. GBA39]|nr:Craniofacial development protein 1 [Mortierella sp. GBA39]
MAKPKPVSEKPPKPDEVESDSDDESDDEDYAPDEKDFQSDGEDLGDGSDEDENPTNDAGTPTSTSRSGLGSSSDKAAGAGGTGGSGRLVTITTTYDFAGETVTVTKDVPEDSKEAKEYAAKNGKAPIGANSSDSGSGTTTATPMTTATTNGSILSTAQTLKTTTSSTEPSEAADASSIPRSNPAPGGPKITTRPSILDSLATKTKAPIRYIRKKSNLDELAATYGVKKPPKLNTLEKSKLDWKNFVGKEGIEDELKHHNKDGYMEKVAFLQRTDERRDQEYQQLKKKRR